MRRALVLIALLALSAGSVAQVTTVFRLAFTGSGGGTSNSTSHSVRYAVGFGAAGIANSPSHSVRAGVWPPLPPQPTDNGGTNPPDGETLPAAFHLYANVPNPFNPRTMIPYDVPAGGHSVQLRIYDVSGHLVRTLVETDDDPGHKEILWDGRDALGREVASGVYYYVLESPNERSTRKMTLLR